MESLHHCLPIQPQKGGAELREKAILQTFMVEPCNGSELTPLTKLGFNHPSMVAVIGIQSWACLLRETPGMNKG